VNGLCAPLFAVVLAGCASSPSKPLRPYSGPIDSPGIFAGDFTDRQRIVATFEARTQSFDVVVQKRGDELTIVGLTPFGSRAFAVIQAGERVRFESFLPQKLPFPPEYVLVDVHRVLFPGVAPPGQVLGDGDHEKARGGEIITETWRGGRLFVRRFRRADADPRGVITVTYRGGQPPGGEPAQEVGLVNGWYGYRLDVTTVSHQPR
jgi:Protein of unknown function (DUF3261)